MSDLVIAVEDVGKHYRLGEFVRPGAQYDSLKDFLGERLARPWRRVRAAPDPADPDAPAERGDGSSRDSIWAIRHVSFEVRRGEAVAIIGRNGMGKSTLLKIISRITEPTEGRVEVHGRTVSLLGVGTGFHPDLTGRENVFMNGSILGLPRREIAARFDEIVEFSEIERFLDTPVKRFSKGMKMRLAMAVAVNLSPDLLIVDEVLAVGDLHFREKCIRRIQSIVAEGATLLFVSHSMGRVRRLCERAILLRDGRLVRDAPSEEVIEEYLRVDGPGADGRAAAADDDEVGRAPSASTPVAVPGAPPSPETVWEGRDAPGDEVVRIRRVRVSRTAGGPPAGRLGVRDEVCLEVEYEALLPGHLLHPLFRLHRADGEVIFITIDSHEEWQSTPRPPGRYASRATVPGNLLAPGRITVWAAVYTFDPLVKRARAPHAAEFEVEESTDGPTARANYAGPLVGSVRPLLEWSTSLLGRESVSPPRDG